MIMKTIMNQNNYVSGKTVVSNLSIGKLGLSVCYDQISKII